MQTTVTERHPFPQALKERDFAAMREWITPTVVLHSPILTTPFEGREAVLELFEVILETVDDFEYTVDLGEGDLRVVSFRTRIGSVEMEGANFMRLDESDRIQEFTVFFRPLPGTTVLAAALGKGLAGRRSRLRSLIAGMGTAPMVRMSRLSDRIAPRLIK